MGSSFFCSVDQTAIKSLHQNEAKVFRLLDQMKRKPALQRCAAEESLKMIEHIIPYINEQRKNLSLYSKFCF